MYHGKLTSDILDTTIERLLFGLLAFMPVAFGVVEPWSELIVFGVMIAMCICLALKFFTPEGIRIVWTWSYIPLGLFLLLVTFQLVPLPHSLAETLAPQGVSARSELLKDLPSKVVGTTTTLSFNAHATKHDLRLVLVAGAMFFVIVNVIRDTEQIRRLLSWIAYVGLAIACLALTQDMSETTKIYWTVDTPRNEATCGPFINHSHFSQFMNLSMGAAAGLLLFRFEEIRRRTNRESKPKFPSVFRSPAQVAILAAICIGSITIFLSLSRNGVISYVVSAAVIGGFLAFWSKLEVRRWLTLVLPLTVLVGILFTGFDAVYERLATVQQIRDDARWDMIRGTLAAWKSSPLFGTGLGTHEYVFPMFDPATIPELAAEADCDYAQILEETGILGALLIVFFLAGFWWRFASIIGSRRRSVSMVAFGLAYGILAVMIQSASDFGQHLPANFCITMIFCAVTVSIFNIERQYKAQSNKGPDEVAEIAPTAGKQRSVGIAALAGISAIGFWMLYEGTNVWIGDQYLAKTEIAESRLSQSNWNVGDEEFRYLLQNAGDAAHWMPDDIKTLFRLNLFRWFSISRSSDPGASQIIVNPLAKPTARRIADELASIRPLCPTYGPAYSVEGQIRLFFLEERLGEDLIRKGYELSPNDSSSCFFAGVLAAREHKLDEALVRFKRSIQLDDSKFGEIVDIYVNELFLPDQLISLVDDAQPDGVVLANVPSGHENAKERLKRQIFFTTRCRRLMQILSYLQSTEGNESVAADYRRTTISALTARSRCDDSTIDELVALADLDYNYCNYDGAIEMYRKALGQDFSQIDWRVRLAKSLLEVGNTNEAEREARTCLQLRPDTSEAMKIVRQISAKADLLDSSN